jgi:hypothetical protein
MERSAKKIDAVSVMRATDFAKNYAQSTVEKGLLYLADPDKKTRLECPTCYYLLARIGGACMTTQPCGLCGTPQTYGSTATDALCETCARRDSLCKHCGGDLHMRVRRVFTNLT